MSKTFLAVLDDKHLAYQYDDENIAIIRGQEPNFELVICESDVSFEKEPNNPYDKKAIAVYSDNQKLGYLYKGKIQDMVNDFLDRSAPISSFIKHIDVKNKKIALAVAFYKEKSPDKIVRITGSGSVEKQDNIMLLSEGDEIEYEYDFDKEKYTAYAIGDDIGFFPKSVNDLLDNNPRVIVNEIEYNDSNDKYSVSASIYVD